MSASAAVTLLPPVAASEKLAVTVRSPPVPADRDTPELIGPTVSGPGAGGVTGVVEMKVIIPPKASCRLTPVAVRPAVSS